MGSCGQLWDAKDADIEPIRKQSDHRLLFGFPWAAVWLRADEFFEDCNMSNGEIRTTGGAACITASNVGELVGGERPTEYPFDSSSTVQYILHILVFFKISTSLSIQKLACSLEPRGTNKKLRSTTLSSCSGSKSIIIRYS